jgi:hypothetical protein
MPKPSGGRKSTNIILTEDTYKEKLRVIPRDKSDLMSVDYVFASAKSKQKSSITVGTGKRNPNVPKRRVGKKNEPF